MAFVAVVGIAAGFGVAAVSGFEGRVRGGEVEADPGNAASFWETSELADSGSGRIVGAGDASVSNGVAAARGFDFVEATPVSERASRASGGSPRAVIASGADSRLADTLGANSRGLGGAAGDGTRSLTFVVSTALSAGSDNPRSAGMDEDARGAEGSRVADEIVRAAVALSFVACFGGFAAAVVSFTGAVTSAGASAVEPIGTGRGLRTCDPQPEAPSEANSSPAINDFARIAPP